MYFEISIFIVNPVLRMTDLLIRNCDLILKIQVEIIGRIKN